MSEHQQDRAAGSDESGAVAFVRCECGAEWGYHLDLMSGEPLWFRPTAKRGAPCQHTKEQAQALVDGEWVALTAREATDAE